MRYLIIFIIFVLFSCSTTSEIINTAGEKSTAKNGQYDQKLYCMPKLVLGGYENLLLKKGFQKKGENEDFGAGLYTFSENKRRLFVTSDIEVFKFAVRFSAFHATSLSSCVMGIEPTPLLLKVNINGENANCLTLSPFKITGTANKFFSPNNCELEEEYKNRRLRIETKIDDIPSDSDVFEINQKKYEKYCIPYSPDNKFMQIERKVLIEKYSPIVMVGHEYCEENDCRDEFKVIKKKEEADFIYSLIEKGIYFYKDREFIVIPNLESCPMSKYHRSIISTSCDLVAKP